MREEDCADSVLVSMDCVSSKQKLDFILSTIFSGDIDAETLESISQLFPVSDIGFLISLYHLFIFKQ